MNAQKKPIANNRIAIPVIYLVIIAQFNQQIALLAIFQNIFFKTR
jgi:hypothetical protein